MAGFVRALRLAPLTMLACTNRGTPPPARSTPVLPAVKEAKSAPSAPASTQLSEKRAIAKSTARVENPILARDLPDPSVTSVGGGASYLVGTGGSREQGAFPILRAKGDRLDAFEDVGKIFQPTSVPKWAKGDFWAPEIHRVDTKWVAYFTARDHDGKLSIGAATADQVEGPYTDLGHPLLQDPRAGVIDPTHFRDPSGRELLVWKLDGNDVGKATPFYVQQLSQDGLRLIGTPVEVLTNDRPWEGINIEGPSMVFRGGYVYLFYSGNMYNTDKYAVGVARSTSAFGPFEKAPQPILTSSDRWVGPGHGGPARIGGEEYFVYHAWPAGHIGESRMVLVDRLTWENGWPKIGNGHPSQEPLPSTAVPEKAVAGANAGP